MSDSEGKSTQDGGSKPASNVWTWIAIGVGTGLLVTVVAGLGYQYYESRRRSRDPRAEKVKDLIEQAERLLAQGRKGNPLKRKDGKEGKDESGRAISAEKDSQS